MLRVWLTDETTIASIASSNELKKRIIDNVNVLVPSSNTTAEYRRVDVLIKGLGVCQSVRKMLMNKLKSDHIQITHCFGV